VQGVVPCCVKPFLRTKRVAGIGKETSCAVTETMLMLTRTPYLYTKS